MDCEFCPRYSPIPTSSVICGEKKKGKKKWGSKPQDTVELHSKLNSAKHQETEMLFNQTLCASILLSHVQHAICLSV